MENITQYMTIIKKHVNSFMTEAFKPYNISGAEAPFIREIADRRHCRQSELSKIFCCDKAHTHRVVTKLIEKGIIQYVEPSSQKLELTPYGNTMVENIEQTIKRGTEILKQGLSQEEIETVSNILKKCAENASKLKVEAKND